MCLRREPQHPPADALDLVLDGRRRDEHRGSGRRRSRWRGEQPDTRSRPEPRASRRDGGVAIAATESGVLHGGRALRTPSRARSRGPAGRHGAAIARRTRPLPRRRSPHWSSSAASPCSEASRRRRTSSSAASRADSSTTAPRSMIVRVGVVTGTPSTTVACRSSRRTVSCQITSDGLRRLWRTAVTSTSPCPNPGKPQSSAAARCDATAGPARHAAMRRWSHDESASRLLGRRRGRRRSTRRTWTR